MSGTGHDGMAVIVAETRWEPLDDGRITVRLRGQRNVELPAGTRLTLTVPAGGQAHRFPAIPQLRQTVGGDLSAFDASFVLPGGLAPELGEGVTLLAGELEVPVPPAVGPEAPVVGDGVRAERPVDGAQSDDPLRAELTARARSEARLRAELAEARARLEARESAGGRLEALTGELASELDRVRGVVGAEAERRREVESRSMVLAAELTAAQAERDEARAEADALRSEGEGLRAQVASLEREMSTIEDELARVRAAEASAEVARESAGTELAALRGEVERLGAARGAEVEGEGIPSELERAEALLAEARALRSSLE
jgi:hypothetical protein